MPAIRCTEKLLKEVGVKPASAEEVGAATWHANLVWLEHRKHVLFCADETLFCCVTPPVRRSEIRSLNELLLSSLEWTMRAVGYREELIARFVSRHETMAITGTRSRSVVGSMNDYVFHFKSLVEWHGGWANCDLAEIVTQLNDIPQVPRDFHNSCEALREKLEREVA